MLVPAIQDNTFMPLGDLEPHSFGLNVQVERTKVAAILEELPLPSHKQTHCLVWLYYV